MRRPNHAQTLPRLTLIYVSVIQHHVLRPRQQIWRIRNRRHIQQRQLQLWRYRRWLFTKILPVKQIIVVTPFGLLGAAKWSKLSKISGTYSCTSNTLFTFPISSYIAGWSGAYFHSPSTINLYWYTPGGNDLITENSLFPDRCNCVRVCHPSKDPSTSTTEPPCVPVLKTHDEIQKQNVNTKNYDDERRTKTI